MRMAKDVVARVVECLLEAEEIIGNRENEQGGEDQIKVLAYSLSLSSAQLLLYALLISETLPSPSYL